MDRLDIHELHDALKRAPSHVYTMGDFGLIPTPPMWLYSEVFGIPGARSWVFSLSRVTAAEVEAGGGCWADSTLPRICSAGYVLRVVAKHGAP